MFADFLWFVLLAFCFVAYIYVFVLVISDLFRDDTIGGGMKALWIVFLIFVPFLTALVYVLVRGKGIASRSSRSRGVVPETDDYRPSASATPADDIVRAKVLLDAGTITQGEFEALKSKALGNQYYGA